MRVQCQTHGEVDWKGHLACAECHRIYWLKLPQGPLYAADGKLVAPPGDCECGKPLLPEAARHREEDEDEAFTARMCCAGCAA